MRSQKLRGNGRKRGSTCAGIVGVALGSAVLLCGAGFTPTGNLATADINANGHSLINAGTVSATNFVGPVPSTVAFASTLTVNAGAVTLARCVLTNDMTVAAPTGAADGARLELWLQASGASRNLSFASAVVVPSEASFTNPKTLSSGKTYIVLLKYDGVTNGGQWELVSIVGGY